MQYEVTTLETYFPVGSDRRVDLPVLREVVLWSGSAEEPIKAFEAAADFIPEPEKQTLFGESKYGPDIRVKRQVSVGGIPLPLWRTVEKYPIIPPDHMDPHSSDL